MKVKYDNENPFRQIFFEEKKKKEVIAILYDFESRKTN